MKVPAVALLNGKITHAELVLGGTVRVGITLSEGAPSETGSNTSESTIVEHNRT